MFIILHIYCVPASLLDEKAIKFVLFLYKCIQLYQQDITATPKLVNILYCQVVATLK